VKESKRDEKRRQRNKRAAREVKHEGVGSRGKETQRKEAGKNPTEEV